MADYLHPDNTDQPNLPVVTDDNWGQGLVTPEMQRQNPVWRFLQDTYPGQYTGTGLVEYTIDDEAAISLVPTDPKTLKIDSLRALEKNTGAGTRALNLLSQQADKHGVSLEGLIHKFEEEGLSKADLLKFYQKAGWELRYPDKVRRSLSEGKAIEDIRVEVIRAPRPPDQPNLPALLGPPEEPGKKPSSKGRMVRGIGSLMRRRIFPLIQAAQMGYDLLPEDKKFAGDFIDYLKETKTHELFGMDKSGLDYLRDLFGMSPEDLGETIPLPGPEDLPMDEASRASRAEEQGFGSEVYYHGTGADIVAFDLDHPERKDQGWLGTGVYLTDSPALGSTYASLKSYANRDSAKNVMPLRIRLKNPYHATRQEKETMMLRMHNKSTADARQIADSWTEDLKKKGHDGVVLQYDPKEVGKANAVREIVVFDTSNVKSAFSKFDPAYSRSPKLSKAAGGFVDKPLYDDARVGGLI